jgi:hypothetical protein
MHAVIRLLAVMSIGAISQALATEPEQPASTAAQPTQASSTSQAAAATSDQQAGGKPAVTPSTAVLASASSADKSAIASGKITPELLKKAHGMGYRVKWKGEDVYFCRKEIKMGSRFETEACTTPEQLDLVARQTQEMVQKAQRIGMPPSN